MGVQEDKKFEVRCSTPAYFKPGYGPAEKRRRSKAAATAKLAEFCIVAQGSDQSIYQCLASCRLHLSSFL